MSEWLKERAWKARVGVTPLPWVRIPLSPPHYLRELALIQRNRLTLSFTHARYSFAVLLVLSSSNVNES